MTVLDSVMLIILIAAILLFVLKEELITGLGLAVILWLAIHLNKDKIKKGFRK